MTFDAAKSASPTVPVVGRFAPSPSGQLHAGNIFSALIAWLVARQANGCIVLRIEDLDPARCRAEYARDIMRDFKKLGFDWDEGPLFQSTRTQAYQEAFDQLRQRGLLYPCFCSRADIHAASAPHGGSVVYAGTCCNLAPDVVARRVHELAEIGRQPAWRVMVPDTVVSFTDRMQGVSTQNLKDTCGDFIVRRADGVFAYQLAVVIDDAAQGVTSVVRGVDLLESAARQQYLQDLLGLPHPAYAHVPLLVNATGRRLSKRDQDASLKRMLETYRFPEALIGHLSYLAGIIDTDEAVTPQELIAVANLDRLRGVSHITFS